MRRMAPEQFEPGSLGSLSSSNECCRNETSFWDPIWLTLLGYDPRRDPARFEHSRFAHLVEQPSLAHRINNCMCPLACV